MVFALEGEPPCVPNDFDEQEVEEYPEDVVTGVEELHWSLPSTKQTVASGLQVLEFSRRARVDRLLIETATGDRLVFTDTVLPLSGRHVFRLRDDESGWWVEMSLDYDRSWRGARTYNLFVDEQFGGSCGGDALQQSVETSTGTRVTTEAVLGRRSLANVEALLEDPELRRDLSEGVPEPVRRIVAQLADNIEKPQAAGVVHSSLIHLIHQATREVSDGPEPAERWVAEVHPHRGALPSHVIEFLSRFEGVDNTDPLAGHHVADFPTASEPQQ